MSSLLSLSLCLFFVEVTTGCEHILCVCSRVVSFRFPSFFSFPPRFISLSLLFCFVFDFPLWKKCERDTHRCTHTHTYALREMEKGIPSYVIQHGILECSVCGYCLVFLYTDSSVDGVSAARTPSFLGWIMKAFPSLSLSSFLSNLLLSL